MYARHCRKAAGAKMHKKTLSLPLSVYCLGRRYLQEELIHQSVKLGQRAAR